MAEKNYPINEAIVSVFKAEKAKTGLTIQMDVYDELQVLDAGQSGVMTEVSTSGIYTKTFTPDVVGEWIVSIYETGKPKTKVVEHYSIGNYSVDSIGTALEDIGNPPTIA